MDAPSPLPANDPAASSRHSLNRPTPGPEPERTGSERAPGAWFPVVLRGYDRAQVDARLGELDRRIRDEAVRADKAEAALGAARSHVRRLQDDVPADGEKSGFGVRLERVLQAAEREAADLRERAATEATELLDKARADAEQQQRRTEQALLGRAATLDQEFTARSAALDAREREVEEKIVSAQREADAIRGQAERAAAEERAGAERRAADLLRRAEQAAHEQRSGAAREVQRLSGLRDDVRAELTRLQGLVGAELEREPVTISLDEELLTAPEPDVTEDTAGADDTEPRTGTLRVAREEPDDNPNEKTSIGTIPPFTASSIGVLPFRERSGTTSSKIRPFAFGPDTADDEPEEAAQRDPSEARTSDDATGHTRGRRPTPTRSTSVSRGPR